MALSKSIPTGIGVPATYWHVGEASVDYRAKSVRAQMYGYASAEARQAGANPITTKQVAIDGFESEPTRADVYAAAKASEDFDGAEDC